MGSSGGQSVFIFSTPKGRKNDVPKEDMRRVMFDGGRIIQVLMGVIFVGGGRQMAVKLCWWNEV